MYSSISKELFLDRLAFVEKLLQKYGAKYIGNSYEMVTWILKDGSNAYENIESPFLVLKFSKEEEGPYEDADSFPYDLPEIECEQAFAVIKDANIPEILRAERFINFNR